MKKTEKIVAALLTISLGILVIILRGKLIEILTTVIGIALIVLGVVDLIGKRVPPAVIKIVSGAIILICGLALVGIVLYVIAALLLIAGILLLYEQCKSKVRCLDWKSMILQYATPALLVFIGLLLLFNQGATVNWIFVVCGILTVIEGGVLLVNALLQE
jgi:hypothetical protein